MTGKRPLLKFGAHSLPRAELLATSFHDSLISCSVQLEHCLLQLTGANHRQCQDKDIHDSEVTKICDSVMVRCVALERGSFLGVRAKYLLLHLSPVEFSRLTLGKAAGLDDFAALLYPVLLAFFSSDCLLFEIEDTVLLLM